VDVVIHIAGSVPVYPSLVDASLKGKNLQRDQANKKQIDQAEKDSTDRYLAMRFMLATEKYKFGKLIGDLEKPHKGMKAFLSTLYLILGLINNCNNGPKLITKVIENEIDGIAYALINENMKEEQKRPSIPLPQLHFSNVKKKFFIHIHVQKTIVTFRG